MRGAISSPINLDFGKLRANSKVETPGPQPRSAIRAGPRSTRRSANVAADPRHTACAVNQAYSAAPRLNSHDESTRRRLLRSWFSPTLNYRGVTKTHDKTPCRGPH